MPSSTSLRTRWSGISNPDSTQPLTRRHQPGTVLVGHTYWTPVVLLGLFTIIYCHLPLLTVLVMH